PELLKSAIELGGDLNIKEAELGTTPMHQLAHNQSLSSSVLTTAIELGGNLDVKNNEQGTPRATLSKREKQIGNPTKV
ncbi:hypothetical protein NL317_32670, partial [Klebsiella pneumoniae]|nr:hypothetical protein [Klebsiella pneumoniae]